MVNRAVALLLLLALASCTSFHHRPQQQPASTLQARAPEQVAAPLGIMAATGGWAFSRRIRARIRRGE